MSDRKMDVLVSYRGMYAECTVIQTGPECSVDVGYVVDGENVEVSQSSMSNRDLQSIMSIAIHKANAELEDMRYDMMAERGERDYDS